MSERTPQLHHTLKLREKKLSHWLFTKNGTPSKTAFWFSATMFITLILVVAITVRFLIAPTPEFIQGLPGIAMVLGIPNAILAGAYTWGKKIERKD